MDRGRQFLYHEIFHIFEDIFVNRNAYVKKYGKDPFPNNAVAKMHQIMFDLSKRTQVSEDLSRGSIQSRLIHKFIYEGQGEQRKIANKIDIEIMQKYFGYDP